MNDLTENQQKFLQILEQALINEQRVPTTRELQEKLGLKSPRSVAQYLDKLEELGYIRRGYGARNIQILSKVKNQNYKHPDKAINQPPKVFISYSHDSSEHKVWVENLARKLREAGVNAILDQWNLSLGSDVTLFMEKSVRDSDFVLMVCTDEYIRKAEAGTGGVGYERLIVTAELVNDIGTKKFIPISKDILGNQKTPSFLTTRFRIETKGGNVSENDFEMLLRSLHNLSPRQPPLGKNPFLVSSEEKAEILPLTSIETADPRATYNAAIELTRRSDVAGWRQLVKRTRIPVHEALLKWREVIDQKYPGREQWQARVDQAISSASSIFALALAGIESGRPEFSDQRALFDDLYNIGGWNQFGSLSIVKLPTALGYFYHSIHGAMCVLTGDYNSALKLANTVVKKGEAGEYSPITKHHGLMGWTSSMNDSVVGAWNFLVSASERHEWINDIFGRSIDYRVSLTAYYILLSLNELVVDISSGAKTSDYSKGVILDVPLCFVGETPEIVAKSISILHSHPELLQMVWENQGVKTQQVIDFWPHWIRASRSWLTNVYPNSMFMGIPHEPLLRPFGAKPVQISPF